MYAQTVKIAIFDQIYDPAVLYPHIAMPPFAKSHILTKSKIREVIDFL